MCCKTILVCWTCDFKWKISSSRSSHHSCSIKKGVLKYLAKFTGKHQSQALRPTNLLKKRLWRRCFPSDTEHFCRLLLLHPNIMVKRRHSFDRDLIRMRWKKVRHLTIFITCSENNLETAGQVMESFVQNLQES